MHHLVSLSLILSSSVGNYYPGRGAHLQRCSYFYFNFLHVTRYIRVFATREERLFLEVTQVTLAFYFLPSSSSSLLCCVPHAFDLTQ